MSHPEYQLVRHKHAGITFEVMTKPGTLLKWRAGEIPKADIDAVLFTDVLFKSAHTGDRHPDADIERAFGSDALRPALTTVLEKGELQLTAAERKEKVDRKRREIVNYIHKYFINPATKTPHPVTRIDAAIDEVRFRVDPDTPAERQAADLLKKLVGILMLKKSEMRGVLTIPHAVLGSCQGIVHKYCEVAREKYDGDGCTMEVAVVPGDYDALMAELARVSKGAVTFNIEGQDTGSAAGEDDDTAGKKGKKGGRGKGKGGTK
jgi:ribosome maturation protein SDO1